MRDASHPGLARKLGGHLQPPFTAVNIFISNTQANLIFMTW